MFSPDATENLAVIVRRGASHPRRKWLVITLLAAASLGGYGYYRFRSRPSAEGPDYVTESVKRGEISLVITAAGNLAPTNQVVVGSELSGTAQEVLVDTNDVVKKGQTLAKLETSKLNQQTERSRAALLATKAKVSQAEATLQESEAALARQDELHQLSGGKTPSKATMQTSLATVARSKADLESAKAAVAGAEAEVRSFERDLEKAIIRSPVDGIVLSRSIEVGQTVAASFTAPTLFTIAEDLRKMELVVAVAEADIGRVAVGQTATFSVDAWPTRTYTATVKKVSFGAAGNATAANGAPNATPNGVVTYSTELAVANEDLSLRPGMTASVDISVVNKKDVWIIPNAALRFDPVTAAEIGKPDDTKRTLVQSLSPGGGRHWGHGTPPPKASPAASGPRVWALKDGSPVEVLVQTGITDGRVTEISGDKLSPDMPVIVSVKPATT
ncbi:MAG: efflux RND transporter periplasmic adaptor subunit [Verrucomicrobia bacterium]|nr:efflux RND transporter periplasmic adaptor subunit [Verrucomicrobiota bacterium]